MSRRVCTTEVWGLKGIQSTNKPPPCPLLGHQPGTVWYTTLDLADCSIALVLAAGVHSCTSTLTWSIEIYLPCPSISSVKLATLLFQKFSLQGITLMTTSGDISCPICSTSILLHCSYMSKTKVFVTLAIPGQYRQSSVCVFSMFLK